MDIKGILIIAILVYWYCLFLNTILRMIKIEK
jgi:hypothetical protein